MRVGDQIVRRSRQMAVFVLASIVLQANLAVAQTPAETVEIAAVGDVLLARGVQRKIERFGVEFLFENVTNILSGADIAFGNLENPISRDCDRNDKRYSFQAKPEYTKILGDAGFDVLSLANNHSFDCGQKGLSETIDNLKNNGLLSAGAGNTGAEAETQVIVESKGIRFAFIGYTDVSPDPNGEQVSNIASPTEKKVKDAVISAAKLADIVVVSFHWGAEYTYYPTARQVALAHAAVEAGADLVLGHHPHVLQGFELIQPEGKRKQALIAYSLGNFVFDSPAAIAKRVNDSVILTCKFSKRGLISAGFVPVSIENYRPAIAAEDKGRLISDHLIAISARFRTTISRDRLIASF